MKEVLGENLGRQSSTNGSEGDERLFGELNRKTPGRRSVTDLLPWRT